MKNTRIVMELPRDTPQEIRATRRGIEAQMVADTRKEDYLPWFKVDDGFATSEPVMRVPRRYRASVIGLWTLSGTWCAKELTDGRLPFHMLDELAGTKAQAAMLVSCGLWSDTPEGYVFIGWDKYQPTREKVEADRKREAERKASYRKSHRDTDGTEAGQTEGHQAESGRPDPTRPDPTPNTSTDVDVKPQRRRGTRIPEPFIVTADMRRWANERTPGVDVNSSTEKFVNYWRAKTSQATKLDWRGTWDNWLISDYDRLPARSGKPTPEQRAYQTMSLAMDIDMKELE